MNDESSSTEGEPEGAPADAAQVSAKPAVERSIAAVVFDMDGVLVESERYWTEEMRDIIETALPADADVTPADLTGINVHEQYDMLADEYDLSVDRDGYFELYDECATSIYGERADVAPELADLVRELKAAGLPVGLATSSYPHWVETTLSRLGLVETFDAEVLAPEIDGPGKPEPHIYELAASRLGVSPDSCLVVEDSANGIEAAARAGAYVIAYRAPGFEGDQDTSMADEVVEGPTALRNRIHELVLDDRS